jgi:hypothetical protein
MLLMRLLGHSSMPAERHAQTAIMAQGVTAAAVTPTPRPITPVAAELPETHAMSADTAPPTVAARPPDGHRGLIPALVALAVALLLAGGVIAYVVSTHRDRRAAVPGPTTTVTTSITSPAHQAPPSQSSGSSATGRPPAEPTLYVTAADCDLGAAASERHGAGEPGGAPLHWTATVGDPLSLSSTSGDLNPGDTDTVTVTLHPATPRVGGAVTVTFTGGGRTHTVRVTWEGEPTPDPSSS